MKAPFLHRDVVAAFEMQGISLPSRLNQMDNLLRFLGDEEAENGEASETLPIGTWALVGTSGHESLVNLIKDLQVEGLVSDDTAVDTFISGPSEILQARLSLSGWRRWEQIHQGGARSSDGFIAMQFGDPRLDAFIRDVIQRRIKAALGVDIRRVDSPDVIRAGLIDNIMREAIEDAAFVLVELSHGNRGAYWEAGLAEGLGKPVIYLCEQAVWDNPTPEQKVHFDVKHRTTVMWDEADPEPFVQNLVATIKNSLRTTQRGKEKAG